MALALNKDEVLKLKLGESVVRVLYCRPGPAELIEALVQKMPRGDERADAERILMANLELGASCITGIGPGDLVINGVVVSTDPESPAYQSEWKTLVSDFCPLILIALGQHVSALPAFLEEDALKKSSGMPGASMKTG